MNVTYNVTFRSKLSLKRDRDTMIRNDSHTKEPMSYIQLQYVIYTKRTNGN